jgi:hypothetical protein
MPFTRIPMLVVPAAIFRADTVVATLVLPDVMEKVVPPGDGAGPERVTVSVALFPAPTMVKGEGVRVARKPTVTVVVAEFSPGDETVIVAVPLPTPFTATVVLDVVLPAVMAICDGVTLVTVGSELVKLRNTVPVAGVTRLTGSVTKLPGVTAKVAGTLICTALTTVTPAVAVVTFGLLAWITVLPGATPMTETVVVVAPAAIVAVLEPTVATVGTVETMVKFRPPRGAGPDRVNVRVWVAVPEIVSVDGVRLMVAVTATDLLLEV